MNPVTVRRRATFSAHVACYLSSPDDTLNDLMLCPTVIIGVITFTIHTMTQNFLKCGKHKKTRMTVTNQIRTHKEIKSRFNSGECLLPFGLESTVFQFAIQKYEDEDIQKYNVVCSFVLARNMVCHMARRPYGEDAGK